MHQHHERRSAARTSQPCTIWPSRRCPTCCAPCKNASPCRRRNPLLARPEPACCLGRPTAMAHFGHWLWTRPAISRDMARLAQRPATQQLAALCRNHRSPAPPRSAIARCQPSAPVERIGASTGRPMLGPVAWGASAAIGQWPGLIDFADRPHPGHAAPTRHGGRQHMRE